MRSRLFLFNDKIQKQNNPKTKLQKTYNFLNFKNINEAKTKFLGEIVKHTDYNITLFIDNVMDYPGEYPNRYALEYTIIEDPNGELAHPLYRRNGIPVIMFFARELKVCAPANAENYYIVNE